jgi:NTP pyrophosphatase (non-canonical NTP hydrolase)
MTGEVHTDGLIYFNSLTAANLSRVQRWHPGFPRDAAWTGADWSNALCGEVGEAANVVKKLRRYEEGLKGELDPSEPELLAMLAEELADVVTYLDLLAEYYGINLATAIVEKFNKVSERQGFPERLQ